MCTSATLPVFDLGAWSRSLTPMRVTACMGQTLQAASRTVQQIDRWPVHTTQTDSFHSPLLFWSDCWVCLFSHSLYTLHISVHDRQWGCCVPYTHVYTEHTWTLTTCLSSLHLYDFLCVKLALIPFFFFFFCLPNFFQPSTTLRLYFTGQVGNCVWLYNLGQAHCRRAENRTP